MHLIASVVDAEINYSLEWYGAGSLCFDHGSAWTVQNCDHIYPVEHWGSGCYQVLTTPLNIGAVDALRY